MFTLVSPDAICGGITIPGSIVSIINMVILVIQIALPIILIVMGMLDLGKAVMAGKEDEIKKYQTLFFKRVIAAVMVFLIIAVVKLVFGVLADASGDNTAVDCISKIIG